MLDGNDITVRIPETGDVIHFPGGTDQNTIMSAMGKLRVQKLGSGIPGAPQGLPQQPKNTLGAVIPPGAADMQGSGIATAISAPKMGLESGLPSPAQVPENVGPMQTGAAIGGIAGAPIAGGMKALIPVARSLAVGAGVSAAGRYGGSEIGSIFGPQGREIGGQIGAGAGLIGGTILGAKGVSVPGRYGLLERLFANPEVSQATKLDIAKQALADNPELAESPQDLISRMKKLVIPGEQPTSADLKRAGDLTQTPLEKLKALAKFGDRLAQNELNRRLRQ